MFLKGRGVSPRFFILVCFSLVLLMLDYKHYLYIYDQNHCLSGCIELLEPYFFHVYTHSINKTPVMEKIEYQQNGFTICESWFKDYSTGIDCSMQEGFTIQDSWFILTLNRETKNLMLAVSPIPGHAIKIKEKLYPLVLFAFTNSIITLTTNFSLHTP